MYFIIYRFLPKLSFLSKLLSWCSLNRFLHHSFLTTEMFVPSVLGISSSERSQFEGLASNTSWEKWNINRFDSVILRYLGFFLLIPNNSGYLETLRLNVQKSSSCTLSKNKWRMQVETGRQ